MNRLWQALACCACALTASFGHAVEVGDYALETHIAYGHGDSATMQSVVRLTPGFRIHFSPRTRVVLEGRIRLDLEDKLEPGEADTSTYSAISRPTTINDLGTAELRDAFVEHTFDNGVLRIGKQQLAWGRLDGIRVTDVLNPHDFREFILEDFDESRISLWSAYLDVSLRNWRTELAVMPDNTGHAIPARGAWFELTAPRYRYGADPADPGLPVLTSRESTGSTGGAWALRFSRQLGAYELGVMSYSGPDHEPLGRIVAANGEPAVERFYERRDLFGVHAETSSGAFAVRAELALQPGRYFNTRAGAALSTVELDQLTIAVGVDIDGPWDTIVNIQHLHDAVRDAPIDLVRPATDRITTLFIRRSFSYESMQLTARYYHSHELGDNMATLAMEFLFGDATRLRIAADLFGGDAEGIFGQFRDRDRFVVGLTHTF